MLDLEEKIKQLKTNIIETSMNDTTVPMKLFVESIKALEESLALLEKSTKETEYLLQEYSKTWEEFRNKIYESILNL